MRVHTLASAVMPWRSVRLGPLHFTPFGLAAALGLIASMTLARRCAGRGGVMRPGSGRSGPDPEAVWDAGLFAIFSCFVASRLLLALQSPAAFLKYPLLLLGLPSLTPGGMALAALASWIYLRRKHLSLLPTLDIFAVAAALLAAFLEVGHWADGSEAGMPTRLPWGVAVAGAPDALRVHPVALYGVVVSMALTVWLWVALSKPRVRGRRDLYRRDLGRRSLAQQSLAPREPLPQNITQPAGTVTSLALTAGGLAAFVLDMLSAPPARALSSWLEPGQWISLAAMLTGVLLWALRPLGHAHAALQQPTLHPTPSPLHMEVH